MPRKADAIVNVQPRNSLEPALIDLEPGDPKRYIDENALKWVKDLERDAYRSEDPAFRFRTLNALLHFSQLNKPTVINKNTLNRQELHLHGGGMQSLPDFGHLSPERLQHLIGELEQSAETQQLDGEVIDVDGD